MTALSPRITNAANGLTGSRSGPTGARSLRLVFVCALLAGILGAAASVDNAHAAKRTFFGIAGQMDPAPGDYVRMEEGNVGVFRIGVSWKAMQPRANEPLRWGRLDRIVGRSSRRGIRVLPVISQTPKWVRKRSNQPPLGTRRNKRAWQGFLRALVTRYGPGGRYWVNEYRDDFPGAESVKPVIAWQLWNEPNSAGSWEDPNPKKYAKLVKLGARAIHSVHPQANVLLAGIFYSPTSGIRAPDFLDAVLRVDGLKRAIHGAAVHPYAQSIKNVKYQIKGIREVMDATGAGSKKLYITEIGWASDGGSHLDVGPRGQARMLKDVFTVAVRKRRAWGLGAIYWYTLTDLPPSEKACPFCHHSGLFELDRTPKPAWRAYKSFTVG